MKYLIFVFVIPVILIFAYLIYYIAKSFLNAYRKFEHVESKLKRFFMALGVALIKGIWANNGTPID